MEAGDEAGPAPAVCHLLYHARRAALLISLPFLAALGGASTLGSLSSPGQRWAIVGATLGVFLLHLPHLYPHGIYQPEAQALPAEKEAPEILDFRALELFLLLFIKPNLNGRDGGGLPCLSICSARSFR